MKQIEVQLREGMARNGITGETAERIITSITSFALYGFPESHAASFALLAYASAYLKVHYPAAFYTALLNNQPMGFYHPATLVKDAQRRGVRFHPIDVQHSDWLCRVEEDGGIRIGFMYVNGLRKDMGQAMAAFDRTKTLAPPPLCAKCGCDDESMIEVVRDGLQRIVEGRSPEPEAQSPEPESPESRAPAPNVLLQHLLARMDGGASSGWALPFDRRRRAADWSASRRADDAGRYRSAQRVHQ